MTDTYELPELPREHKRLGQVSETCSFGLDGMKVLETRDDSYPVYTADQMRAYGQECARLAVKAERERAEGYREALAMIAAQGSANPGSTSRVDCMAALAAAAIRKG